MQILQPTSNNRFVYSVNQLNSEARNFLERGFPPLWVEGEISNFRDPGSGHWYFTLKDNKSQIRCAMFRMKSALVNFRPKDGLQVLIKGKLTLYEERGDFQLVVESMEEAGDGALRRAFETLKKRLAEEGLFATENKKHLPKFPQQIGIITSPTGAAVRDILTVLKRRCISLPVIIYPSQVQGADAAKQLVQAIQLANARQDCDVLILSRGGGSLEDLWPFNEEIVARAIFNSTIPIISGVGHEIDFTIADFVADHRAATPSAAAELVSQNTLEWQQTLEKIQQRLQHCMQSFFKHAQLMLQHLQARIQHPQRRLQDQSQKVDELYQRLCLGQKRVLREQDFQLQNLNAKLQRHHPQQKIDLLKNQMAAAYQRLTTLMEFQFVTSRQKLSELMRMLDGVSPLNTLKRGFAIVTRNEHVICDASELKQGDEIKTKLANGTLLSLITSISK